jgi:hypothetical protein
MKWKLVLINIWSSNKEMHTTVIMLKIIFKNTKLQHVSDLIGPSSGSTLNVTLYNSYYTIFDLLLLPHMQEIKYCFVIFYITPINILPDDGLLRFATGWSLMFSQILL